MILPREYHLFVLLQDNSWQQRCCWYVDHPREKYYHVWLQENLWKQNVVDTWSLLANIIKRLDCNITHDSTVWLILWLFFANKITSCGIDIRQDSKFSWNLSRPHIKLLRLSARYRMKSNKCGWYGDPPSQIIWLRLFLRSTLKQNFGWYFVPPSRLILIRCPSM